MEDKQDKKAAVFDVIKSIKPEKWIRKSGSYTTELNGIEIILKVYPAIAPFVKIGKIYFESEDWNDLRDALDKYTIESEKTNEELKINELYELFCAIGGPVPIHIKQI